MLPKANRLVKKKDFQTVFKRGKNIKNHFLYFKVLKNNLKKSRFGFVVSKKVSSKANQRNKVKRRLRSVVLSNLKEVKEPVDVIIIASPGIVKKKFSDIQDTITKIFRDI